MLQAPTGTVPYFHFICTCGKPVNASFAWFKDDKQYHKECLPPGNDVSEEYHQDDTWIDDPERHGDDWGPENTDDLGFDSPTDFDEYEMNPEDSFEDPFDPYDIEYDR